MKKLSKEKRQQLILTVLVTAIILFGLWYGVIRAQVNSISQIQDRSKKAETQLADVKKTIARAEQIHSELEAAAKVLEKHEGKMASGDLYAWAITSIRNFKTPYKVDIPQFSQIDGPKDSNILPNFPYKQASLTVAGTGRFYDIGTFIADFENEHPFMRVCNLVLDQAPPSTDGQDKLSFRMEIVMLVKPTT